MGCFQIAGSQPECTCTTVRTRRQPRSINRRSYPQCSGALSSRKLGPALPTDLPLRPALPCAARTNIRRQIWPGVEQGAPRSASKTLKATDYVTKWIMPCKPQP